MRHTALIVLFWSLLTFLTRHVYLHVFSEAADHYLWGNFKLKLFVMVFVFC